jgi:hypothetical protein
MKVFYIYELYENKIQKKIKMKNPKPKLLFFVKNENVP